MDKQYIDLMSTLLPVGALEASQDQIKQAVVAWRECRAKRLETKRLMEEEQEYETFFMSYVMECLRQQKSEGVLVGGRVTALGKREVATVSDKEKLVQHIKETGDIDLLQFRLATGAVDERRAADVKVPGVEYIEVYTLSDKKS